MHTLHSRAAVHVVVQHTFHQELYATKKDPQIIEQCHRWSLVSIQKNVDERQQEKTAGRKYNICRAPATPNDDD